MLLRPVVTYGCVVWWRRSLVECAQRQLSVLQRLVCIGATGALRTTPTQSLEVVLDLPPLHLYIQYCAYSAYCRLNRNGQWKGKAIWDDQVSLMPQDQTPSRISVEDCFDVIPLDREDWHSGIPSRIGRSYTIIYTDGSLMGGLAGAGIYCENPYVSRSVSLGSNASVFQSEVYAILCALDECKNLGKENVLICSDSKAAIQALACTQVSSRLVSECRQLKLTLQSSGKNIRLAWVPGHVGVSGNEMADELARIGSSLRPIAPEPILPLGPACVKMALRSQLQSRFVSLWQETQGLKMSKQSIDDPRPAYGFHRLNVKRNSVKGAVALLTGHGPFRSHLVKMGYNIVSTDCRRCGLALETAHHILCECPALLKTRFLVFGEPFIQSTGIKSLPLAKVARFSDQSGITKYDWI